MKYLVLLGDGMADEPIKELGGKTPLQYAKTPLTDELAKKSEIGLCKTVPDHLKPGSDVANLSVMGYDPDKFYTGRSPLEAASIGVTLLDTDVTFRCNLVTLSEDEPYEQKTMVDYSSDEITTEEAQELIKAVDEVFHTDEIEFKSGISYRHLLLWHHGPDKHNLTPPHDISDKKITDYLPDNPVILNMMKKSNEILKNHPVNQKRKAKGLRPANSIWIWGEGKRPALVSFTEKYGVRGSVISAVDLIKGLGILAKLQSIDVEGATGTIDTNFAGKAQAAIDAFKNGQDFVYLHVEAADESGHRFEMDNKVKAIEALDAQVLRPVYDYLKASGEDFSILFMPDHPTPLRLRTHTNDAVPYLLYRSNDEKDFPTQTYDEKSAEKTGNYVEPGYTIMDRFLAQK